MIADEVEIVYRADTNAFLANVAKAENTFSAKLKEMQAAAARTGAAFSPIGQQATAAFSQVSAASVSAAKSIHAQATADLALARATGTATAEQIRALTVAKQQAAASLAVARADHARAAAATAAGRAAARASVAPRAAGIQQSAIGAQFSGFVGPAAAGVSAAVAARQFVNFTDSAVRITNALKVSGIEGEELSEIYQRLGKVALENGANFEAVALLYSRVTRASEELGISGNQAEEFTRRIAVGLRASGTGAAQTTAGLQQLNQALASGVLRGDEFNSVMENIPVVAKAIADGLGVSVGALRAMAEEGELTATKVFDAFMKGSANFDAQAAKTAVTFSQSFENISTALTIAAGKFNETTGASRAFASAVNEFVIPAIASFVTVVDNIGDLFDRVTGGNAGALVSWLKESAVNSEALLGVLNKLKPGLGDLIRLISTPDAFEVPTTSLAKNFQDAIDEVRRVRQALAGEFSGISDDFAEAMEALRAEGKGDIVSGLSGAFIGLTEKIANGTATVEDFDRVIAALIATGNETADKLAGRLELIQAKLKETGAIADKSFQEAGKAIADAFGTKALGIIDTLIDRIGNALPASVRQFAAALREAAALAALPEGERPTVALPRTAPVPTPVEERFGLLPTQSRDPAVEQARVANDDRIKQEAKRAADKLNDAIARQTATAVDAATLYLGQNERTNRGSINSFLKAGGVDLDAATTAWCAAFVNSALAQVGVKGSGSNVATDFLNFGTSVNLSDVQRGDILVDPNGRKAGQTGGHVGFATGQVRATAEGITQLEILSGNASDQVSKDWINASEVVARRATSAFQLPANSLNNLTTMSAEAKAATDAQTAAIKAQDQAYQNLGQIASTALNGIATALADGKIEGEEILQIISQIVQQLLTMPRAPGAGLFGGATGGGGGGFGDLIGGFLGMLFGGFKASGGPVSGSKAYVVGEKGPEIFVPSASGRIIPNMPATPNFSRPSSGGAGGFIQVSTTNEVINGNLMPTIVQVSGIVGGQQIKQNNKTAAARLQQNQARGTS